MPHKAIELVNGIEVADLTKRLIEFRSVNPPGLEYEIAEFVAGLMSEIGMEVKIDEVASRRSNVVGWLKGLDGSPTLMMNGHLDVVPAGDLEQWNTPPFRPCLRHDRIYGRGASDMKGGLASTIEAVKALVRSKTELRGNLLVTMVVDEEGEGKGTLNLIERGYKADMAVIAEPSRLQVLTAEKGVIWAEITTHGKSVHASMTTSKGSASGINAINKMARVISALEAQLPILEERKHPLVGNPTTNVGTITGGTKPNVVPDLCKATIDRRLVPGERTQDALHELTALLSEIGQLDQDFKYDMKVVLTREPIEISPEEKIVRLCRSAAKSVTGRESGYGGFVATTDRSFLVNQAHIPTVILGPGDLAQAHSPNEYVETSDLVTASKIYTQLIIDALG
ncbi:M20 family peptidase [archaeon]|nr:MAG: M20 family peptidase [archaeon]